MHNPNGARGGGGAEREVTHWNLSHQLYKVTRGPGKEGRVCLQPKSLQGQSTSYSQGQGRRGVSHGGRNQFDEAA